MMHVLDYERLVLGFLTLLAQSAILTVALWCGVRSMLRLRRPVEAAGLRPALVSLGLSLALVVWAVHFYPPGLSPGPKAHLWAPLVPLGVAASSATLRGLRGRRLSGTVRMMAVVAVIALVLAGGTSLQRWDFRRANLREARLGDRREAMFREAAEAAERCEAHVRCGGPCKRCRGAAPGAYAYYAKEFHNYAAEAARVAASWRRRAEE